MELLIFFFFVGGLILVAYLGTTSRHIYLIRKATEAQNNISRKILEELRKLNAAEPDKRGTEPERPKRGPSKPKIYEL